MKKQDRLWNMIPTITVFAFYVNIEKAIQINSMRQRFKKINRYIDA